MAGKLRGRRPGPSSLDTDTVSTLQDLVVAEMNAGQAAKQLAIGRLTAYRYTQNTSPSCAAEAQVVAGGALISETPNST